MRPADRPGLTSREPTDSDVDLRSGRNRRLHHPDPATLAVIALGGALGAAGRYLLTAAWPAGPGAFPASTLVVNVLGALLIGVLMVLATDVWSRHRLLRPFAGTGLLGGFTTFSTYTVQTIQLLSEGRAGPALGYLLLTLVAALLAVWGSVVTTRLFVTRRLS